MLDYITKPTADAVTDLTNADEHLSVAEGGDLTTGAGTFDIYVAIAGTVSVTTGGVLTAANDGDEAEFFYTGSPGGNIGIDITSGSYAGTYTTDYLGSTFTLADVQAAPVCLVVPTVSGNTGNGDTLTIKPSLWIYDGPAIAPLTRQQKTDGVNVPIEDGGDELTYVIDIAQVSGQDFTVAETFGGTTVTSAATTIDTFTGSWMGADTDGIFHYDPAQIVLDGSNNVLSWPNTANGGAVEFNLDIAPSNGAMPTWDVANSKLVGNGVNHAITADTGGVSDPTNFAINGGYSMFVVADAATANNRDGTQIIAFGGNNQYVYIGLGQTGGNLSLFVKDSANVVGTGFGQDAPLPLNSGTITAGKHLVELRVDTLGVGSEVNIYIDGALEYTQAISESNSPGTRLTLLAATASTGTAGQWWSDGAVYEAFNTSSTGAILDNIRGELATKHSITLA